MTRAGDTVEARLQRSLERENTVDADKTCGFSVPGKNTAEKRPRRESPRRLVSVSELPSADGSLRHSSRRACATRTFRGAMLTTLAAPTSRVQPRGARAPRATAARGAFGDARVFSALDDVGKKRSRRSAAGSHGRRRRRAPVRALFDPDAVEDPLVRKAMKEPVAFFGGMFAGFLGLSVDDEASPLSKWVRDTSEAAGARRDGTPRAPAEEDAIDRTSAPSVSNEGATGKTAAPSRADEEGENVETDVAL